MRLVTVVCYYLNFVILMNCDESFYLFYNIIIRVFGMDGEINEWTENVWNISAVFFVLRSVDFRMLVIWLWESEAFFDMLIGSLRIRMELWRHLVAAEMGKSEVFTSQVKSSRELKKKLSSHFLTWLSHLWVAAYSSRLHLDCGHFFGQ
jgi:hypothetical protein